MGTSHLVAALVGAWLASPLCLCLGVWLARRADEERERAAYRRGRTGAFEEMGRGRVKDAGERLLDEIAAEFAENNHHWHA